MAEDESVDIVKTLVGTKTDDQGNETSDVEIAEANEVVEFDNVEETSSESDKQEETETKETKADDKEATETTKETEADSSLNKEEIASPETKESQDESTEADPAPEPEEVPTLTFDQLFEQEIGVKLTEELKDKLKNPKPPIEFADEQVQKLNDYVKEGGDLMTWVKSQTLDVDALSNREAVIQDMKDQDPDITDAEINIEMKKYKSSEDDDDDEIEEKQVLLAGAARKSRKRLSKKKDELALPPVPEKQTATKEDEAKVAAQQEQLKKQQEDWKVTVDSHLKDNQSVKFLMDKDNEFNYDLKDQDLKTKIEGVMKDPMSFWNHFTDKDGQTDMAKLQKTMLLAFEADAVIKAISDQAKTMGAKNLVKEDIKNIDFNSESGSTEVRKSANPLQQVAEDGQVKY